VKYFICKTALQYLEKTFDDSVGQTSATVSHVGKSTAATS